MKLRVLFFVVVSSIYGYVSTVSPTAAIDKIPGTVILVMDSSLQNVQQVRATSVNITNRKASSMCSNYITTIRLDASIIKQTTEALFENVVEQATLPTQDQLRQKNANASIFVKLDKFYPQLSFQGGYKRIPITADASCEIVLAVTVRDANNKNLMLTSLHSSQSGSGNGGVDCSGGAKIMESASNETIHAIMKQYSDKIRTSFITQ